MTTTQLRGTYTRWTQVGDALAADILGADTDVMANPATGRISATVPQRPMSPDEARMIGVRLIEAAALADGDRCIRGRD